jgi:hypothetical protein
MKITHETGIIILLLAIIALTLFDVTRNGLQIAEDVKHAKEEAAQAKMHALQILQLTQMEVKEDSKHSERLEEIRQLLLNHSQS